MTLLALGLMLVAYVLGSIPVGLVVGRLYGVDIRTLGSGNIGATNVLRNLGKVAGLVVFVIDVFKGVLAVLLARLLHLSPWEIAAVGVGMVVGHTFSMFLGFKGGKGVATSFGTIVAIAPIWGLLLGVIAFSIMAISRYVSLGSVIAGICLVIAMPILSALGQLPWAYGISLPILGLLVIWAHRENIARLRAGTENKLGQKRA